MWISTLWYNFIIRIQGGAIHHSRSNGDFYIYAARNIFSRKEHVVLIKGIVNDCENVLCRVESECVTGIVFDSLDCDCKDQLVYSLNMIEKREKGIFILLRQEGRGLGLATKIEALKNKNKGYDTYEAVELLGKKPDVREYSEAACIINKLKIRSIELLTNNPEKVKSLKKNKVKINSVIEMPAMLTPYTEKHLRAKQAHGFQIKL
jgi:3,4-dihydroxy 2-butanone 4-phosphate synthase/GTP cyclohydrolase II